MLSDPEFNEKDIQDILNCSSEDEYNFDKLKKRQKYGYKWNELYTDHIMKDKNLSKEDMSEGYSKETFEQLYERRKLEISQQIWGEHGYNQAHQKQHKASILQFEREWKLAAYKKLIYQAPDYVWHAVACNPALMFYIERVYDDEDGPSPKLTDFDLKDNSGLFI